MVEGHFQYRDDLLKHHVRTEAWLPLCESRLKAIQSARRSRRLRYFTFCAVDAIDVLMLNVAGIIRPSTNDKFDTVFFFDRNRERVIETQKSIPGAVGFPGNFVDVVLTDDPDEDYVMEGGEPLEPPESDLNESKTRERQRRLEERQAFIRCFPFDVINLDLEEFLFKPYDPLPGKLINAFRKVFSWQHRNFPPPYSQSPKLDCFSLMFTTQIGPPNMSSDYLSMLRDCLETNINDDGNLITLLADRTGVNKVFQLQEENFDLFFKLAMPKVLAATLMEEDWYVDPDSGISIFEFERPSMRGPYKMLHLIMNVRSHNPPRARRRPGQVSTHVQEAYRQVVRQIFSRQEFLVSEGIIDQLEFIPIKPSAARA